MEETSNIKLPRRIEKERLLLVEGIDDVHLCTEIQKYMLNNFSGFQDIDSIQLWDYKGIENLHKTLKIITSSREYSSLRSIGIMADADENASYRLEKIKGCITRCNCTAPKNQLDPTLENPSIIVLVVPKKGSGMIEKLCLDSVCDDPAIECVNKYVDCLKATFDANGLDCPKNRYKAKLQVFLASRKRPGLSLGHAAMEKYFPLESEVFDDIKEIMALMIGKRKSDFKVSSKE